MKHLQDNKTIFSSAADHILLYYCENFTVPTEFYARWLLTLLYIQSLVAIDTQNFS